MLAGIKSGVTHLLTSDSFKPSCDSDCSEVSSSLCVIYNTLKHEVHSEQTLCPYFPFRPLSVRHTLYIILPLCHTESSIFITFPLLLLLKCCYFIVCFTHTLFSHGPSVRTTASFIPSIRISPPLLRLYLLIIK